jgi:ABC-type Fe3+/spermidine/putrescine transport system ATPase subunit
VGLARALARQPALYLFDEPTAHLDAHLRGVLLDEVARHQTARGAAAVYSTHDAGEALAVSDAVAVIDGGRLVQLGPAREVYERPAGLAVARLTGPGSILRAVVVDAGWEGGGARVVFDGHEVELPAAADLRGCAGVRDLLVRPEWAELGGPLPGRLITTRYRGPHTDYTIETAAGTLTVRRPGPPTERPGRRVGWTLHRVWPLPTTTDPSQVPIGVR